MLNFNEFITYTENHIKEHLPASYENASVETHAIKKNNGLELHGLVVRPKGTHIVPTIYLEGFFDKYLCGQNINDTLQEVADMHLQHTQDQEEFQNIGEKIKDYDAVKDMIVMDLVNMQNNEEVLQTRPYTRFEDLAITYKMLIDTSLEGTASIRVDNSQMALWGISKEELHKQAMENSNRMLPASVRSMSEVIRDMMVKDGTPEEIVDMMQADTPMDKQMFVITNKELTNGAATIVYSDALEKLSERLDSDLFILPSSVHEVIAVPTRGMEVDELVNMVTEVNENELQKEDKLSDHVYRYDSFTKKLSLADTTVEAIEAQRVSEQGANYSQPEVVSHKRGR